MHSTNEQPDHNELDLLLPWYVNGTLDTHESLLVEQHLAGCPECRSNVELLSQMNAVAETDAVSAIVPKPRIDKMLGMIDRDENARASRKRYTVFAIAATVTSVIIGIAFIAANGVPHTQQSQVFETATTPATAAPIDYVLLVEYEAGTSATQRRNIMDEFGATELGPGGDPATYRVLAAVPAATAEELNAYVSQFAARDAVRTVQLIAVQLPVQ